MTQAHQTEKGFSQQVETWATLRGWRCIISVATRGAATGLTSGSATPKVRLSMLRKCTLFGCQKPSADRHRFCSVHRARFRRHGDPLAGLPLRSLTPFQRFWHYVQFTDTCWLWLGARGQKGYGSYNVGGQRWALAHRYAYQEIVGPIQCGLVLDHLCRVRHCVNPDHLEPVTSRENTVGRGLGRHYIAHRQGVCTKGHSRSEGYERKDRPGRWNCNACRRDRRARLAKSGN